MLPLIGSNKIQRTHSPHSGFKTAFCNREAWFPQFGFYLHLGHTCSHMPEAPMGRRRGAMQGPQLAKTPLHMHSDPFVWGRRGSRPSWVSCFVPVPDLRWEESSKKFLRARFSLTFFFSFHISFPQFVWEASTSAIMASTTGTRERKLSTAAPITDFQEPVGPPGMSRPKHKRTVTGFGPQEIKSVEASIPEPQREA